MESLDHGVESQEFLCLEFKRTGPCKIGVFSLASLEQNLHVLGEHLRNNPVSEIDMTLIDMFHVLDIVG